MNLKLNNANPYEITKFDVNAKNAEIKLNYEAEEKAIMKRLLAMKKSFQQDLTKSRKESCLLPDVL